MDDSGHSFRYCRARACGSAAVTSEGNGNALPAAGEVVAADRRDVGEAQRDRNIAIAVGVIGGIVAGASAGAVLHVGRQNRLGEAKEKVAQYEVEREKAWDYAEYYLPLTSQILTELAK